MSLVNQVLQFTTYANPVLSKFVDPAETLVSIWIGINDISDSADYDVDFPVFYNELVTTLFQSVQQIYDQGYKDFLFMNLPPLNRTPGNIGVADPSPNATQISWYDGALKTHSLQFAAEHSDATLLNFDVNTFLNGVIDNAAEYGIKNTTGYCTSYDQPYINTDPAQYDCLPLPEYFWFNTGHLTSHTHEILADAVENFLKVAR